MSEQERSSDEQEPAREQGGQVSEVASLGDPGEPVEDSQSVAGNVDEEGAPDVEAGPDAKPGSNVQRNRE